MALQQLTADVSPRRPGDGIAPTPSSPVVEDRPATRASRPATGLVLLVLFVAELVTLLDVPA